MAINDETLHLVAELRAAVDAIADDATRELTKAWVAAWDHLMWEWAAAVDELAQAAEDSRWPSRRQVLTSSRVGRALTVSQQVLDQLAAKVLAEASRSAQQAAGLAASGTAGIVASQFPETAGVTALTFERVSEVALGAIVQRSIEQITSLAWPLASAATEAMKTALIRGVVVGDNPRTAARQMLTRLEGEFNGGLARATTIARTEMLDAHRIAAQASQGANSDVLAGWVWTAKLDTRTCPSCWARHGELHALAEPGPLDHQNGRCARTPKTKSWKDLGFGVAEPPDRMPDARATFDRLPRADKLTVMGPARLDLLDRGEIGWADLSRLRRTDGWRDSYGVTPLKYLRVA